VSADEDAGSRPTGAPPLAPDRPYVDGTATSPAELRAEAAEQAAPELQQIADDRAALAATVAELSGRLDVRARARDARGELLGGAAAAVLLVLLLLLLLRRRRRRTT
jgi:hypothetical protein